MQTRGKDVAFLIKERVSCRQFLEAVGVTVNGSGFAVCPFHGDRDASLKVYSDGRGWCCFGCHKGGDVINLAMEWYGESFPDTLRRIDADFGLKLFDGQAPVRTSSDTTAMQRLLVDRKRQKSAEAIKKAEDEYFAALDEWLKWREIARVLRPQENGGELYAGYAIALKHYYKYDCLLARAETRRAALCWKRKTETC